VRQGFGHHVRATGGKDGLHARDYVLEDDAQVDDLARGRRVTAELGISEQL